mmetsp:Transcript_48204/g.35388  ORF Transcript_48204/g.35388 Transcript_48204/m.35388 type:complete len:111 (+) Transcript_48204:1655-1987(+)
MIRQKVERLVEGDVDDKTVAMQARNDNVPYAIFCMNQAAAKYYRKELFAYMKKNFGDHFDPKEPMKDIEPLVHKMEQMAEAIDSAFINMTCNDDTLPLIELEQPNANESE